MKKFFIAALLAPAVAFAQNNYPSPTFNSLTLLNPLTGVNGGTGVANSGTITLGGNLVTSGANPLTFTTTGSTNVTLPTSGTLLNGTSGATAGANSNITSLTGLTTPLSASQGGTGATTSTGSGSVVLSNSPTLTTPALGIPSSVTLTNGTGLPVATGISGLGAGVAAALGGSTTGSGGIALSTSPTFTNAISNTPAQFDNSTRMPTTAFVQRALGNDQFLVAVTGNTNLVAGNAGEFFVVAAVSDTYLPLISSVTSGATFYFSSAVGQAVIATTGSDLITVGNQSVQSITLGVGDTVAVVASSSGGWFAQRVDHKTCQNILDYGGDPSGALDNSAAFAAAVAANTGGSACVLFPAGTFVFTSQLAYTLPTTTAGITILGAGIEKTKLEWAAGGGIKITMPGGTGNNAHIRDLSLLTGTAGSGNAAVTFNNVTNSAAPVPSELSDFTNVSIHGIDGYALTDYWAYGIYESSWSNIVFANLIYTGGGGGGDLSGYSAQGIGVYLTGASGSSAPPQGTAFNFTNCFFNYMNMGIEYNSWTQGVNVNQGNFTGGKFGIYVSTPDQGQDQLNVTASQFNVSDGGIVDSVGVPGTILVGNYFFVPTPTSANSGVSLNSEYEAIVTGNVFQRIGASTAGTNGLVIGTNIYAGAVITANVFTGLGAGIFLENTSSGNNVQSNAYHANSTNIVNSGTGNVLGGGSQ